ncbi:MAG: hypothetical protein D3914_04630 [Candidatus Electrothrix sp. LOE2]|nr:hypothetical protein [Candidatus Electrothrix sp. LOE2]
MDNPLHRQTLLTRGKPLAATGEITLKQEKVILQQEKTALQHCTAIFSACTRSSSGKSFPKIGKK